MKNMVNLLRKYIAIFGGILCTCISATAQNIDAAIAAYAEKYSPERAYIHYDKTSYSPGETIWFKVYLMSEVAPATESKTMYIDWIDDNGNLLIHGISPLSGAMTNGQFDIPADYKGQFINIRAYTKWMLNFDSAFLYNKSIRILSRNVNPAIAKRTPIPSITFFPEGGDAIAGIPNKIAFKANDQWGLPVRVKGVIVNSQGKALDSIRTQHDGMGYFYLIPQKGLSYTAKWKDEKSVEHTTPLPEIKIHGAALQITLAGTNRLFAVNYSPDLADAMDTLHLIGTMYQHEAFRIARATSSPSIKGTIPTRDLPSGILTITLFDKNWNPLAERITYVNNQEYFFQPEMEVQRWGLNKRAKNEIKITVPDSLTASLSVSVTDAAIGSDSSNNIISHFLLTSELKGQIYNPAYYFSGNADSIYHHLDLVMLTHGWRRFAWEEIVKGRNPKLLYAKDTSYLSLSGKVFGVMPGQIGNDATIILIVKQTDAEGKMVLMSLLPDGTFNDPSAILFDTAHVYYQFPKAKTLNDASVSFMTNRLPAPSYKAIAGNKGNKGYNIWPADTTGNYRQWLLADEANSLSAMLRMKTLENVTVKSRTRAPVEVMDDKYTSGLFKGGDGYQFDLLNDPFAGSAINIFSYLQGKVAGLQINADGAQPSLQWRGGSPQLYLDETPADASFISSVNVRDVAYIKVFRPPFMGGYNGANGAIAIYTRRGNDVKSEPGKGLSNNKVFGYTLIKEFYSPNYGTFKEENKQRDIRTTLYWNPSVVVSPQKKQAVISFYNNDVSGSFRVIIEGMTSDGRLAHIEQIME